MIAYKGFHKHEDGTLWYRDFQYEVGKTYKLEEGEMLCYDGHHAYYNLHDAWFEFPNNGLNVYYEVECNGRIYKDRRCTWKFACSEMTLIKEIDVSNVARFDYAGLFHEGYSTVELDDKWNLINTEGKLMSKKWFNYVDNVYNGYSRVMREDEMWNFIDVNGEFVSDRWWKKTGNCHEGMFAVQRGDGMWNYMDEEGNMLSSMWYGFTRDFHKGFAAVKIKTTEKWNFVNKYNEYLSDTWFDWACDFVDGFASARIGKQWFKINTKGQLVEDACECVDCRLKEKAKNQTTMDNNYNMSFAEAQDYISKRGLDIQWNDNNIYINSKDITQTVANVLKWADEHPVKHPDDEKQETPFNDNDDEFRTTTTHVFFINDELVVADSEEEAIKMFRKEQIKIGNLGKVKSLERLYGRNDYKYDDLALIKDFEGKNDPNDLA